MHRIVQLHHRYHGTPHVRVVLSAGVVVSAAAAVFTAEPVLAVWLGAAVNILWVWET